MKNKIRSNTMNFSYSSEKKKNSLDYSYQLILIIAALVVFMLEAKAWPLSPGRDFSSYVTYYLQLWEGGEEAGYPRVMLHRTPLFPLLIGWSTFIGGSALLEYIAGIAFVVSVILVYRIGRIFSDISGVVAAVLVLIYPAYGAIFHFIGSEFLTSLIFLYWVYFVIKNENNFSLKKFFICGVLVGFLIWTRPSNQIFILFSFYPFFLKNITFKSKIQAILMFFLAVAFFYLLLSFHNLYRYKYFGLASGNRGTPFLKVFVKDKLVKPENGLASEALGNLVEKELLDKRPYLEENITKESFFENPTARKWFDILILSERFTHPEENLLRHVAIEAIKSDPIPYLGSNVKDILSVLLNKEQFYPPVPKKSELSKSSLTASEWREKIESRITNNEDNDIAISYYEFEMYQNTESLNKIVKLQNKINTSIEDLPQRDGDERLGKLFNFLTTLTPAMLWFVTIGSIFLLYLKIPFAYSLFFMMCLAMCSVIASCIAVNTVAHYRIIYDPIFILFFSIIFSCIRERKFELRFMNSYQCLEKEKEI